MKLINCPVCGARVSADIESCPECGFEVKKYLRENNSSETGADSSGKRLPLLITAPAVVLAIVVLLFFFFPHFKAPTMDHRADAVNEGGAGNGIDGGNDAISGNGADGGNDSVSGNEADGSNDTVSGNEADGGNDSVSVNGADGGDDVRKANDGGATEVSPVGVYSGNDSTMIVIHENGYAYYYYTEPDFTELECPWTYSNETVSIELSKMHCTITARKMDENFSELIFRADSKNWNPEVFTRLNLDPDDYIGRYITAYDPAVTVLHDGSMTFELNGIHFTIPKMYRELKDEFDKMEEVQCFVDVNTDLDYVSSLFFYRLEYDNKESGKKIYEEINQDVAVRFIGSFLKNPVAEPSGECVVAGYSGKCFDVSGIFNNNFQGMYGNLCSGKLYIIRNGNSDLYILMLQLDGRGVDASGIYEEIIDGAE